MPAANGTKVSIRPSVIPSADVMLDGAFGWSLFTKEVVATTATMNAVAEVAAQATAQDAAFPLIFSEKKVAMSVAATAPRNALMKPICRAISER